MPATLPNIDSALFDRFKQGDEQAFEQIYRLCAPGLGAAAMEDVGHASGAMRAIEQVMVRAWAHRSEFGDTKQLHDLLALELHEASLREKGRRQALRRFEEHEGGGAHGSHVAVTAVDANETWAKIQKSLHPDVAASASAKRAHAAATRHEAAAHIAGVGKPGMSFSARLGIAVVVVTVFGGALYALQKASAGTRVARALNSKEAVATSTKPGQRGSMKLAEGSNAELGGDATLTIPKGFPKEMRAVKVDGTARFTVAAGVAQRFEVRAGNAAIIATGTMFTVSAYANEPVVVLVDSGSVSVSSDTATRALTAGQAVLVQLDGALREPSPAELSEATGWTQGRFFVNNRPIREILPMLKRWYTIDVRAAPALLPRLVTMNAALGATDSVITALETAGSVKQIYLKGVMILEDAPPKPETGAKKGKR